MRAFAHRPLPGQVLALSEADEAAPRRARSTASADEGRKPREEGRGEVAQARSGSRGMSDARARRLFRMPLALRWRDLDAFNHVNNSNFLTYLEEARIQLVRSLGREWVNDTIAPLLAAVQLNYRDADSVPGAGRRRAVRRTRGQHQHHHRPSHRRRWRDAVCRRARGDGVDRSRQRPADPAAGSRARRHGDGCSSVAGLAHLEFAAQHCVRPAARIRSRSGCPPSAARVGCISIRCRPPGLSTAAPSGRDAQFRHRAHAADAVDDRAFRAADAVANAALLAPTIVTGAAQ